MFLYNIEQIKVKQIRLQKGIESLTGFVQFLTTTTATTPATATTTTIHDAFVCMSKRV